MFVSAKPYSPYYFTCIIEIEGIMKRNEKSRWVMV